MSSAVNLIVAAGRLDGLSKSVQKMEETGQGLKQENDASGWVCGLC